MPRASWYRNLQPVAAPAQRPTPARAPEIVNDFETPAGVI
jgi:hypothetical protein